MAFTLSSDVRTSAGNITRTLIKRSCCKIEEAASPDIAVVIVVAMSPAVTPNCDARKGSMLKVTAGPLIVTPLNVSTTPATFLIDASTSSAFACRAAASSLKSFTSIGSGFPCKSPMTSGRMPTNSNCNAGFCFLNLFAEI